MNNNAQEPIRLSGQPRHAAQTPIPGLWLHRVPPWALPAVGAIVGTWAIVPPYVGPRLHLAARAEVADHVVPGVTVIAVSAVAYAFSKRSGTIVTATAGLLTGLVIMLAGLWMAATHLPMVAQVHRRQVSGWAAVHHILPGLAVLALGGLWVVQNWSETVRDD